MAWAAVTGTLAGTALYLFAIVFFWTPPHFWALSLLMKDEYAKAGVPMLPVVRGEAETRRQILLYTVLLYAVTQLPFCAGGVRRDLPRRLDHPRRRLHRGRRAPLPPRRPPLGAAALPVLARLPRRCCSRRWWPTPGSSARRVPAPKREGPIAASEPFAYLTANPKPGMLNGSWIGGLNGSAGRYFPL